MFSFELLNSETSVRNLFEQVHWRDDRYCPHCRSESVINYGSYRVFQRYRCTDCGCTFNDKTGRTIDITDVRTVTDQNLTEYRWTAHLNERHDLIAAGGV